MRRNQLRTGTSWAQLSAPQAVQRRSTSSPKRRIPAEEELQALSFGRTLRTNANGPKLAEMRTQTAGKCTRNALETHANAHCTTHCLRLLSTGTWAARSLGWAQHFRWPFVCLLPLAANDNSPALLSLPQTPTDWPPRTISSSWTLAAYKQPQRKACSSVALGCPARPTCAPPSPSAAPNWPQIGRRQSQIADWPAAEANLPPRTLCGASHLAARLPLALTARGAIPACWWS